MDPRSNQAFSRSPILYDMIDCKISNDPCGLRRLCPTVKHLCDCDVLRMGFVPHLGQRSGQWDSGPGSRTAVPVAGPAAKYAGFWSR